MFVRKIGALLGATTMVASGFALAVAGPAHADPASGVVPGAKDIVGAGSDTTQLVMQALADSYNSTVAGQAGDQAAGAKVYSWDACTIPQGAYYPCNVDTTADLVMRSGAPARIRPNGSGAGLKALGSGGAANDFPEVSFARSSSALADADAQAGLVAFPFAVDGLDMVTAATSTHAPANLTAAEILGIYNGTYTKWNQLPGNSGGSSADIHAYIPQANSGTGKFFIAQLKTITGASTTDADNYKAAHNTAWNPTAGDWSGDSIQEHDPTAIKDDPDAIGPFSVGREKLINASESVAVIKKASSWSPIRAVYNMLRTKDNSGSGKDNPAWFASTPAMKSIFGPAGFLCSPAAKTIIEAQGFQQLKRPADGGACGIGITQSGGTPSTLAAYAPGNGKLAPRVGASAAAARYGVAHRVNLQAIGTSGLVPTGALTVSAAGHSYRVNLGATGKAVLNLPASLAAGRYPVRISYPGDRNFTARTGSVTVTVTKVATSTRATPTTAKVRPGHAQVIKVTVTGAVRPTGQVAIFQGHKRLVVGALKAGVKKLTLKASQIKKFKKGKKTKLTVKYLGGTNFAGSTRTITIVRK